MAVGHLLGWRGDIILAEGDKFASSAGTYNTISPGPWVDTETLPPFVLSLDKLHVEFNETPGRSFGTPRALRRPDDAAERARRRRRRARRLGQPPDHRRRRRHLPARQRLHPVITVRDAKGPCSTARRRRSCRRTATTGPSASSRCRRRAPKQLGFTGFFLPTAEPTFANGPVSLFPDTNNPELALSVWEGNLFPGGAPQSVYTLNTDEMKQVPRPTARRPWSASSPGRPKQLPGGRGSITFDSVKRFAGLSVRTDPGAPISLVSAILATLGLILGLTIKRRRVFVRVRPADGPAAPTPAARSTALPAPTARPATVVTIGGLSKDSDPGLAAIVTAITTGVHDRLAERTDRS